MAKWNPNTGAITDFSEIPDVDINGGNITNVYIVLPSDDEVNVCRQCNEHTIVTKMVPDNMGNGLHGEEFCTNPDCEDFN